VYSSLTLNSFKRGGEMRKSEKRKIVSVIATIALIAIVIFSLFSMLIGNHMLHRDNPTAVFVKPLPKSITSTAILQNGQILIMQFDPISDQKARAKITWGDRKNLYLNIFKNGKHLDSIQKSRHCIIATGRYVIEVIERDSGKVISTVNIESSYQKAEATFFDKPVLMEVL